MPGVEPGGLSGEAVKAEWLPGVMEAKQRAEHERLMSGMGSWPKGMKAMPFRPRVPWTSLGQAPTEAQLEANDYTGAA